MSESFDYIESGSFTDKGLVRENNEDAVLSLPQDGVFGVSDGMGGGSAGELASAFVMEELESTLSGTAEESPGLRLTAIREALDKSHARILAHAKENGYAMMGATVAMIVFNPWDASLAYVVHAGDSRVYRLRGGVLDRLTVDHTLGADLARLTGDGQASSHKESRLSHVLTRAVGVSDVCVPEMSRVTAAPGDMFIICTDGVSTMVDDDRLRSVLDSASSPNDAVSRLAEDVRAAGAVDNFSFVICKMATVLPAAKRRDENEERESAYLEERWNG